MRETATRYETTTQMTVAEYLASEPDSPVKREYVDGNVYAFAGTRERHNRVAVNIAAALLSRSRGGPCRVLISDVQLQVSSSDYYYPDVMVVCDPSDDHPRTKQRPSLVVEVLSPSTSRIDRHEKLHAYKQIESLRAYLIVDPDARRVTRHWRVDANTWERADIIGDGDIPIPFPESTISLAEVCEGID